MTKSVNTEKFDTLARMIYALDFDQLDEGDDEKVWELLEDEGNSLYLQGVTLGQLNDILSAAGVYDCAFKKNRDEKDSMSVTLSFQE